MGRPVRKRIATATQFPVRPAGTAHAGQLLVPSLSVLSCHRGDEGSHRRYRCLPADSTARRPGAGGSDGGNDVHAFRFVRWLARVGHERAVGLGGLDRRRRRSRLPGPFRATGGGGGPSLVQGIAFCVYGGFPGDLRTARVAAWARRPSRGHRCGHAGRQAPHRSAGPRSSRCRIGRRPGAVVTAVAAWPGCHPSVGAQRDRRRQRNSAACRHPSFRPGL